MVLPALLKEIAIITVLLALIDLPYLTLIASKAFRPMIMQIQGSPLVFRLVAAIPVYLALAYLLTLASNWRQAALIGGATYAVYDFTNYATLKDYTLSFALQDTTWGAILFGLVYKLKTYLGI